MAHSATMSSKGQLVIPAAIRKKLRLKGGAKVAIEESGGEIRIRPNPHESVLALRGCLADIEDDIEGLLMEERRKERKREERKLAEFL